MIHDQITFIIILKFSLCENIVNILSRFYLSYRKFRPLFLQPRIVLSQLCWKKVTYTVCFPKTGILLSELFWHHFVLTKEMIDLFTRSDEWLMSLWWLRKVIFTGDAVILINYRNFLPQSFVEFTSINILNTVNIYVRPLNYYSLYPQESWIFITTRVEFL